MKPLLSDALWFRIKPLLPAPWPRRYRYPGRYPIHPRRVLTGILFVLKTGIAWDDLPAELGLGCGRTCRTYLPYWQQQGVWKELHQILLNELQEAHLINWERASIDSGSVSAPLGGDQTGPNPTDRGKIGTKHHIVVDGQGIPLAATITGANRSDHTQALVVVDAIPLVQGSCGRPRHRPKELFADRGYDSDPYRHQLKRRGIRPRVARRRTAHGSGWGRFRWVVERTLSWLHGFGRLRRRLDRSLGIHQAWLLLAMSLICYRFL